MSFHPNDLVRRGKMATILIGGAMAILLVAFFRAQVLGQQGWLLRSESNSLREVPIPAPRGVIYDRTGKVIAENTVSYSVSLLAVNQDSLSAMIGRLQTIIPITRLDSLKVIARYKLEAPRPTVILADASFDKISVLEEHRLDFPSLIMQTTPHRVYPAGAAVGPFVGYTGEINEETLARLADSGYKAGQQIGLQGLEEQYEKVLRGQEGSRFVEVDAKNRVVTGGVTRTAIPATRGHDLRTNIDLDLQIFVAKLFADSLIGAVVAIEPSTGEVLALYSGPSYDPNRFIGGASPAFFDSLNRDTVRRPMYNKALQGKYPPGSTFKLATAVIGLEDSAVTMSSKMPEPCTGSFYFGNIVKHCWTFYSAKGGGQGSLDLSGAIENSCDIYFYQLGIKLGLERLVAGGVGLGFTRKSGIDLPAEHPPNWPDAVPQYFDKKYGPRGWSHADALNLAIGQGENAQSPVDMARFYTALATDGQAALPEIAHGQPQRTRIFNLPPDQMAQVREALVGVVASGTATSAAIKGVLMGGKTGTAQSGHFVNGVEQNDAWFVGFAPADSAKIVVAVMLEFGGHGTRAARIASTIIEHYLHAPAPYLGVPE